MGCYDQRGSVIGLVTLSAFAPSARLRSTPSLRCLAPRTSQPTISRCLAAHTTHRRAGLAWAIAPLRRSISGRELRGPHRYWTICAAVWANILRSLTLIAPLPAIPAQDGAASSQHVSFTALDFKVLGMPAPKVAQDMCWLRNKEGFFKGGIGRYNSSPMSTCGVRRQHRCLRSTSFEYNGDK